MGNIDVKMAITICCGVLAAKVVWFITMNILSRLLQPTAAQKQVSIGVKGGEK